MNTRALRDHPLFKPALGAGLAVFCGLALGNLSVGEAWRNASYDWLFRFATSPVTNQVVVILMDNQAYDFLKQERGQPWDREIHAELLQRLADDGCTLVVIDLFLQMRRDPAKDAALAAAMLRQSRIVLLAGGAETMHPGVSGVRLTLPTEPFLSAAGNHWGVARLGMDSDSIVRRHWPFPAPGPYPSLPATAARLAGASLREAPQERWLRYYGAKGPWTHLSYGIALTQPTSFFRDKIVFIGSDPLSSKPDDEEDEFRTPYTGWTGESMGGVQIIITSFLNLMNDDWLRRSAWWLEALVLVAAGVLLGGTLPLARPWLACSLAAGVSLAVMLGGVSLSYYTNFWIPWLVIAGGQVPCALAWALAARTFRQPVNSAECDPKRNGAPKRRKAGD